MKISSILLFTFFCIVFYGCKEKTSNETQVNIVNSEKFFQGKWVRRSPNGPLNIYFKTDGKVEIDIGDNNSIGVVSNYKVSNDTLVFFNEMRKACPNSGTYKIYNREHSISFDLIKDECNGRIKSTMGFWVRPNHQELLSELNSKIKISDSITHVLNRGRMYLALGKPKLAQKDFNVYLINDSLDAKVFIHRAATRFPNDSEGILDDCNRAIQIDSTDKNAYFIRGLALYELGERQEACDDFKKSIELGFTILKQAEKEKCEEFWEN